jgi:molybdopterin/thiamine biosynthesis adenylyltransferase
MLTKEQKLRYNRQLIIPGFTEQDQEKLFQASVLVIGAGGLGSPVLSYLSSAGIGSIGIVDADRVELSNLQRQILYSEKDIGKQKVDIAAERLRAMNSSLHLKTYSSRWDRNLASSIASNYHVLIDCTDNIASRIITDAISVQVGIPFIYGAVNGLGRPIISI